MKKSSKKDIKGYKFTKIVNDQVVQTVLLEFLTDDTSSRQKPVKRVEELENIQVQQLNDSRPESSLSNHIRIRKRNSMNSFDKGQNNSSTILTQSPKIIKRNKHQHRFSHSTNKP